MSYVMDDSLEVNKLITVRRRPLAPGMFGYAVKDWNHGPVEVKKLIYNIESHLIGNGIIGLTLWNLYFEKEIST